MGDIIITTILVLYLRKHKSGFQASDLMVDRIIRLTVQTCFITSVVAILDVSFFLADPTGTHLMFNFPLCKLYSNSLMSSLNSRRGWKYGNTTIGEVSPTDTEGAQSPTLRQSAGMSLNLSALDSRKTNLTSLEPQGPRSSFTSSLMK